MDAMFCCLSHVDDRTTKTISGFTGVTTLIFPTAASAAPGQSCPCPVLVSFIFRHTIITRNRAVVVADAACATRFSVCPKGSLQKSFLSGRLREGGLSRPHRGGHRCLHRRLALAGQPAAGGAARVRRLFGVAALGRHGCALLRRVSVDPH